MNISKRIKLIVNQIDKRLNATYYDIGCDHGLIGYEILQRDTTNKVVFCDILDVNLNKAKVLCESNKNICERSLFCLSNGVPDDAKSDGIGLIFGLGGETIIDILKNNISLSEFYLQPLTSKYKLRNLLVSNNYEVINDVKLFYDKYNIDLIHIKKANTKSFLSDKELILGKDNINRRDDIYLEYLRKEYNNLTFVLALMGKNMLKSNACQSKYEYFKKKYNLINEILEGE